MPKDFESLTWGCTVWCTSRLSWQFFYAGTDYVLKNFKSLTWDVPSYVLAVY